MHFVIQEHHARTHHFDFRLERGGVLKSWAVPKGLPLVPGVRRLAVEVEDHDLSFGSFEGTLPAGEYGAGEVKVWDSGTYVLHEWTANRISFCLNGQRVVGEYELVRFRRKGDRNWLLWKRGSQE